MGVFEGLKPEAVWGYFEEICQVPRPSKKEGKIIAYLLDWAKKHNLEAKRDDAGNVLIKKPATKGKENAPTVILQAHMDRFVRRIQIRYMILIKTRYNPTWMENGYVLKEQLLVLMMGLVWRLRWPC